NPRCGVRVTHACPPHDDLGPNFRDRLGGACFRDRRVPNDGTDGDRNHVRAGAHHHGYYMGHQRYDIRRNVPCHRPRSRDAHHPSRDDGQVRSRSPPLHRWLAGRRRDRHQGDHLYREQHGSDAQIAGNAINGTGLGIQVEQPSAPTISGNTITNVSGVFAVGILVNAGATAAIDGNTITGVRGANGGNGLSPGAPGRDGAFAVGIYVNAAPSASITTNTVDTAIGGRGGDGQTNPGGTGGRGGNGGSVAGIVVAMTSGVYISGNTITNLQGGAGGSGGGGATTTNGGSGGSGGTAAAIEAAVTTGFTQLHTNGINGVTGGGGGAGATGSTTSGNGGAGGDADGLFFITAENADAGGNTVSILHGGLGGNGGVTAGGGGNGGTGGGATAFLLASVVGSASVGSSTMDTLTGGDGGRGAHGGYGGN